MGLFDDFAMGFGLKPKTQDFVDRTAKTIERTQGSDRAATYSNQMSNKGFENNYTPSEGSVAVVQQSSSDNDNKNNNTTLSLNDLAATYGGTVAGIPVSNAEMPVASEPATQPNNTMQDPELPDEGLDMTGPDFGGLLNTDCTTYNSDKFVGYDTTSGGNTIGYASSGDYAGYAAIVRPDGNVEILGPGSTETGIIFEGDNRVDAAINYLTGTGTASGESIFMSDFDRQDKNNLLKLKRLEVLGAIALENQQNNNVYDAAFDLNEDGKVSLLDISQLNMMYGGPTAGGTQRTQKFADLFAMDVNPNTSNQTSNLADGLTAPTAASASINPDNGYIDITFNGLGGQAVTVSGRTMEEARAKARDHGDSYITNLIAELNDAGTLTDQQRQDLRNAIGWKATFNPDGTQPYNAYTQLDSSSVGLNDAASQLNQFEIDNLLIPTFSADPYTGSQSNVNVSGVYNSIINDGSISDDAKRYALASVMSPTLTDLDLQKYDLSGDGVISQEDTGIAQTNYLTQNNAIVQNPNATNVWEFSSTYNVNPDEQYVNFNQSGTGNSIAQTNIGELFQDGNTYKFKTKDGIIAKEFTDLQDAIRFVSPNAGYEFGKFSNQFQQYDSYEPYYYTSNSGVQMGLSTSELSTIDDLRSQQINERLKSMYDYRQPVTDTTPIDMGSSSQFISKPDRQDAGYQTTDPYDIYTRDESTDQQAGVFQAQPNQPQFIGAYTGQVNPTTGTYTVMEPMQASRPSVGGITTGVMGTQQQQQTTLPLTNTGYGPRFMNEGGVVPQQQQMQPQGTFGGFKPQAMQRIAGSLGYTGDMSGFDQYLNANPDKKQKMDMYTQQAIQMAKGGMPKKVLHAQNGTYVEGQSDPRVLGQQYIPQQDFTVQDGKGYSLQDVMSMQAVYPGLPEGATVTPTGVQFTGGQFVNPYSGQVYGNAAVPTQLALLMLHNNRPLVQT